MNNNKMKITIPKTEEKERFISKHDAKSIVDTLFDGKLLHESVTRHQMNVLEALIDYMMDSRVRSYLKGRELIESLDKIK